MKKYKWFLRGLQFFAEPGGDDGQGAGNGGGQNQGGQGQGAGDEGNPNGGAGAGAGKTFSQADVNTLMATEKRSARNAVLKELGFEIKDDKTFADTMKGIKETLDAGKTQAEKDKEAKEAAEQAKKESDDKASKLEMKVAALTAGVNPEFLDDVIILAQSKVNDTNTVEKVMEEFKTKYPAFFKASSEANGTGHHTNPPRKQTSGSESLGQRLAKANKTETKSSYFKH